MRRIGVLMNLAADDSESPGRVTAFAQGLQEQNWSVGRNIQIEYRWAAGEATRYRKYATELAELHPDAILAVGGPSVVALQQVTLTIPMVFVSVVDPVGAGFVASMARPAGNTTGFTQFEYGLSGKWLELLKEIAPQISRVAVLRDPTITSGTAQFAAIQAVAPAMGNELTPLDVRDPSKVAGLLDTCANGRNEGLLVTAIPSAALHRQAFIDQAAPHRPPAMDPYRYHVTGGGLASYGPDLLNQYRLAAGYVDRILKGEKPADLPVQSPTKYELAINLKTAKALGLTVPDTLLARADEV